MIPTTATSSSSTSSSTTSTLGGNCHHNSSTAMIGIASLILEGRAISEDEFVQHHVASRGAVHRAQGVDSEQVFHASGSVGDQQSPRPSTSRAATSHMINITTNPHMFGSVTATAPSLFDDIFDDPSFAAAAESRHQRWTQKLYQLRQVSPASTMSRECVVFEQKVGSDAAEPALAINAEASNPDKADFEIVRRVILNRSSMSNSGGSAASSPGSADNFLHSLQSLATTCLRGGSPAIDTGVDVGIRCADKPIFAGSVATPRHTILRSTPPRSSNHFINEVPGSASSSGSGIQSPLMEPWLPTTAAPSSCGPLGSRSSTYCHRHKFSSSTNTVLKSLTPTCAEETNHTSSSYPQQGPHCEQFLRKMGLGKGDAETEDHFCDMSYVNITCSRWRAYNLKMEAIIARGEPVCIEVFLGPEGHKILLEQWILTQKEKVTPPNMTLLSLCSAIRSQLYFSQISAWCDLIKKSDNSIYDTGRVIFPATIGVAGDLATTGTSPASNSSSTSTNQGQVLVSPTRRPRLNIFYRIKRYDSTACFNCKPNVHNFPSVIISEGCSLSVCLKSLPRINGGIPKLGTAIPPFPIPSSHETFMNPDVKVSCGDFDSKSSITADSMSYSESNGKTTTSAFAGVVSSAPPPLQQKRAAKMSTIPTTSQLANAASAFPAINCDINKASDPHFRLTNDSLDPTSPSCHSTGKHKCTFFIDEEELGIDEVANEEDDDCTNSSGGGDSSFNSNLSHREKQLMKYRKRMLKRDKKSTRKSTFLAVMESCDQSAASTSNGEQHSKKEDTNGIYSQPMDQGEEVDEELTKSHSDEHSRSTVNHFRCCTPSSHSQSHNSRIVTMISTGTQTQMTCCQCGGENVIVCLSCENSGRGTSVRTDDMDEMDSCSISSSEIIHTPRNNAELLLQAIQRTPKAVKKKKKKKPALHNFLPLSGSTDNCSSKNNNHTGQTAGLAGCQVCKRQKTQHNFGSGDDGDGNDGEIAEEAADEDENDGGERHPEITRNGVHIALDIFDQESFVSSTKLTPHIDKCTLYSDATANNKNSNNLINSSCKSESPCNSYYPQKKMDDEDNTAAATVVGRRKSSCTPPNKGILLNCEDALLTEQFKTPTNTAHQQKHSLPHYQRKQTPKPTLLEISAAYNSGAGGDGLSSNGHGYYEATPPPHNALLLRKGLPKVNLTPIFCNPSATACASPSGLTPSPIPISSCSAFYDSEPVNQFSFEHVGFATSVTANMIPIVDNSIIPVQKSLSAPTLPNSLSLSPRFAKQAAIYKRRSRHLSDRSDRSSLGSDEQFSDEDLESGMYTPATSPMKMRSRVVALFGRRSLLGNLEESLLQRRLNPKVHVVGFKVLLGASGGFCPTQLTIPAAAYFYELRGEALSTPYVCDIRLPRKGYSVPRAGTIQATLLNPMGTVVRMFVIPYDMRDMPPMHQTFIRQRILAEASINETIASSNYNIFKKDHSGENNNNLQNVNSQSMSHTNSFDGDGGRVFKVYPNRTGNYNTSNNKYRQSPNGGLHGESNLGHFISTEHMKRLRYSIHLRFQTSRSGRLSLHTDIRLLISRRTDCDTAAAHAKGVLEAPNDLVTDTVMPSNPKYSARQENPSKI